MKCQYCGSEVAEANVCPNCGATVATAAAQPEVTNQQPAQPGSPQVTVNIIQNTPQQTIKPLQIGAEVTTGEARRSRGVYIILALLFGCFGVHNWYAGRNTCAGIQLGMTLLSFLLWGLTLPIVVIWVIVEICVVQKDGKGVYFN